MQKWERTNNIEYKDIEYMYKLLEIRIVYVLRTYNRDDQGVVTKSIAEEDIPIAKCGCEFALFPP